MLNIRSAFAAAVILMGAACAGQALAADARPLCPGGQIAHIRVSSIKPTGSIDGFKKAVADNNAWYRAHGMTANVQTFVPILTYDRTADSYSPATTEVMTIHYNPPQATGVTTGPRDAAWEAFVAAYKANSDIVSEKTVCLPK